MTLYQSGQALPRKIDLIMRMSRSAALCEKFRVQAHSVSLPPSIIHTTRQGVDNKTTKKVLAFFRWFC
jgi:hypothetical protein